MASIERNGKRYFSCEICQDIFEGFGNNPDPFIDVQEFDQAECCDNCNYQFVIPARLKQLTQS